MRGILQLQAGIIMCIIKPKVRLGTSRQILDGQMGNQGKKDASNTFVLPAISTHS